MARVPPQHANGDPYGNAPPNRFRNRTCMTDRSKQRDCDNLQTVSSVGRGWAAEVVVGQVGNVRELLVAIANFGLPRHSHLMYRVVLKSQEYTRKRYKQGGVRLTQAAKTTPSPR